MRAGDGVQTGIGSGLTGTKPTAYTLMLGKNMEALRPGKNPSGTSPHQTAGPAADFSASSAGSAGFSSERVTAAQPPAPSDADACERLLRRSRHMPGEPAGGEGGEAELAGCLRRLHRAQNRFDPWQLRQLGQECLLQAENSTVCRAAADPAGSGQARHLR